MDLRVLSQDTGFNTLEKTLGEVGEDSAENTHYLTRERALHIQAR